MRHPLTILAASRFYFDRGGAQAAYMASGRLLRERGHKVIPFAGRHRFNEPTPFDEYFVDRYADFDIPNLSLWEKFSAGLKSIYALDVVKQVSRIIRDHHPDIADVHNIFYQLTPSLFRPLHKAGVPVVFHLHDYGVYCANGVMETHGGVCERCCGHRYYNAVLHRCYHNSFSRSLATAAAKVFANFFRLYDPYVSRYVVTSVFQKNLMARWGLSEAKMDVIPLFFDGSYYPNANNIAEEKRVLFFGEMKQRKGPQLLYEAAKRISNLEFVFVGEGPLREQLSHRSLAEGVSNVYFYDFLPKEKLFLILRSSLFAVMPSIFYESFGRMIIEAFYYCKPVIGSRIGAIPEVVEHGRNGFLFEPGNVNELCEKILLLFENRQMRLEMGNYARQCVETKYSKEIYYARLMHVYDSALNNR